MKNRLDIELDKNIDEMDINFVEKLIDEIEDDQVDKLTSGDIDEYYTMFRKEHINNKRVQRYTRKQDRIRRRLERKEARDNSFFIRHRVLVSAVTAVLMIGLILSSEASAEINIFRNFLNLFSENEDYVIIEYATVDNNEHSQIEFDNFENLMNAEPELKYLESFDEYIISITKEEYELFNQYIITYSYKEKNYFIISNVFTAEVNAVNSLEEITKSKNEIVAVNKDIMYVSESVIYFYNQDKVVYEFYHIDINNLTEILQK